MASTDMDTNRLDDLVCAYLAANGTWDPNAEVGRTKLEEWEREQVRKTAAMAEERMRGGDVDQAEGHARRVNARAWDEPRLQFRVQGQKLVEMLRSGDDGDVQQAVRFARDVLGPMALDAYPEAYDEFKTRMMAFVVGPDGYERNMGCRQDKDTWSDEERNELAKLVYVTLVQSVKAYEPELVLLVKYLMLATDSYCKSKGVENEAQWMFEALDFHRKRLPAPLPHEGTMVPLNEADVQSLVQAMQIPRQEAVQGLRQVEGDLEHALKNELARVRIEERAWFQLVLEYAAFQGLARPCFQHITNRAEMATSSLEATCSDDTAGTWSVGEGDNTFEFCEDVNGQQMLLLRIFDMVYDSEYDAAETVLLGVDGKIFENDPSIVFDLKRRKYYHCLRNEAVADALGVVRNEMSPLAMDRPELQRKVEDAMLAVTQAEKPSKEVFCDIDNSLRKALNRALEVPEPRLLQGLRFLLCCHVDWYALQQCQDKLATHLGLETLSKAHLQPVQTPQRPLDTPDPTPEYLRARYGRTRIENQWMMDRRTNMSNENSILTLMEFMALSREDAIRLLREHGGSVEAALSSLIP
mmetsp:Transcript_9896/g.60351  ORF Transcript_9896/g.60351 Transcript_9896/m.60351 type:complete len:582 (-) Transcript_9896:1036-2781(-)